jgi:two-component system OmpR family sensor kinase
VSVREGGGGWRRRLGSLRFRLTAWYCLVLLGTLAALGTIVYVVARQEMIRHHDSELEVAAHAVQEILREHEDCAHLGPDQLARLDAVGGLVLVHDVDGTGQVFYRSPASVRLPLPHGLLDATDLSQEHASFETLRTSGGLIRVHSAPYRSRAGRPGLVRVMESLGDVEEPIATLRSLLLLLAPVGVLVAFGGGLWLSDRALRPVDRITTMARDIEAHNLSQRIPVPRDRDEMGRLVETLNQMIARLEGSFAGMKAFTADASHELRTPLASIQGTVDVVLAQPRRTEEYVAALRSIGEDVQGVRCIVDDLLVLAQADAGSVTLRRERVELHELLAEVVEAQSAAASAKGVVVVTGTLDEASVHGDELWLRQLVANVVDNAVKFSAHAGAAGARVEVSLIAAAAEAIIRVRDSGPGIPEAELPRLFDRFYRGDAARTRGEGVGLGLAISAWVARSHGGSIELRNAAGGGAECLIRLPSRGAAEG